MKTKVCFKCETELPIVNFYKHKQMADGYLGKCKACTRYDVRKNRKANHEYYLEYDRKRSKDPKRIAAIQASGRKDRVKASARWAIQNAVARGKVMRQPCEQCGNPRTDAHHPDYTKPLDVVWLCRQHHMDTHRIVGDA
jgi:uncharacterized OB-fold protein